MGTFADAVAQRPQPPAFVVLAPEHFHPQFRPASEVAIGVRLLSGDEAKTAEGEAMKAARGEGRTEDEANELYNEEMLAWAAGFAATDPNDATKPYFPYGEADARLHLTTVGLRAIWDKLEDTAAATSPLTPLATDEELADLGACLAEPMAFAGLARPDEVRLRRWATLMRQTLAALDDLDSDD